MDSGNVLIESEAPTYHYIAPWDSDKTACGVALSDEGTRRFNDPGDGLVVCEECDELVGQETVEELVEWFADDSRAGFDMDSGGPPSYLSNDQLTALMDYVVEQQEKADAR